MRSIGISVLSALMTGLVVGNAFYQKKQFFPSIIYITKSNASMAVIYVQFFVIVLMMGKLLRKIFLGTLRAAEFEHFMEKFWYALTETALAFTVFRDDFNPRFVALFTVLLFLKSFHWLAEERVDYMERSPVIGWLFHVRVASLLTALGLVDYILIMYAYNSTIARGPTVQLVFGFEYAILITMVASIAIKYVLHAAETRADTPWENKAVFLLYTELVIGLIKVVLYAVFVIIMARTYALPMFVFRPMFYTFKNFKKALNDVIMSRRAIRNMNTLYPDATPEELTLSDNICIICREDMVGNSKKLPCGHIFHTACLRSWFQRQQTCPTCRLNILRTANPTSTTLPRQQEPAPAAAPVIPPGNVPNPNAVDPNMPGPNVPPVNGLAANNPFFNMFNLAPGTLPTHGAPNAAGIQVAATPFMFTPPFPFITPFTTPPPPMPPGLETLSDEELRAMEGVERRHVEERIKLLRNIKLMLDASTILMQQYSAVVATLPSSGYNQPTGIGADLIDPTTERICTCQDVAEDTAESPVSKKSENEVTIEDVGEEEHSYKNVAAGASSASQDGSSSTKILPGTSSELMDLESSDNSEISELRKRRLQKFSHDVNKELS